MDTSKLTFQFLIFSLKIDIFFFLFIDFLNFDIELNEFLLILLTKFY